MQRFDVDLPHGIRLACRSNEPWRGHGVHATRPRVLFLHGFPEAAFVWDEVVTQLGGVATALAPNLRGYDRSSAPASVDAYQAQHLLQDITSLIEAWGQPVDLLVAHDWGGALAWALAARRPELLRRLLILNAPHPATFVRELRDSPAQQAASAYMSFLVRPDAARLLAEDDFRRLWAFFDPAPTWLDASMRAKYRATWARGLEGALNYYRATPLRPATGGVDAPLHRVALRRDDVTVRVPVTVLWGDRDPALLPSLLDGLADYVPDLAVIRVADASHWIVHEEPARVVGQVRSLIQTQAPLR